MSEARDLAEVLVNCKTPKKTPSEDGVFLSAEFRLIVLRKKR